MKIAVPITSDKRIDDHFGHCEYYGIYTISADSQISDVQTIKSEQGCGCKSNIASVLSEQGVTVMLAGGIGGGAINVLNNWGIDVIRGCSGPAADVVNMYVEGKLIDSGSTCSHHADQGSAHQCNH